MDVARSTVELVQKHDQDLYRGNGKPGITTRLALVEDRLEQMKQTLEDNKKRFGQIVLMVTGIVLTMLADIFVRLFVGGHH